MDQDNCSHHHPLLHIVVYYRETATFQGPPFAISPRLVWLDQEVWLYSGKNVCISMYTYTWAAVETNIFRDGTKTTCLHMANFDAFTRLTLSNISGSTTPKLVSCRHSQTIMVILTVHGRIVSLRPYWYIFLHILHLWAALHFVEEKGVLFPFKKKHSQGTDSADWIPTQVMNPAICGENFQNTTAIAWTYGHGIWSGFSCA